MKIKLFLLVFFIISSYLFSNMINSIVNIEFDSVFSHSTYFYSYDNGLTIHSHDEKIIIINRNGIFMYEILHNGSLLLLDVYLIDYNTNYAQNYFNYFIEDNKIYVSKASSYPATDQHFNILDVFCIAGDEIVHERTLEIAFNKAYDKIKLINGNFLVQNLSHPMYQLRLYDYENFDSVANLIIQPNTFDVSGNYIFTLNTVQGGRQFKVDLLTDDFILENKYSYLIENSDYIEKLYVLGDYAFVIYTKDIYIFDISDTDNVNLYTVIENFNYNQHDRINEAIIIDNYLHFITQDGFKNVFDISNPQIPVLVYMESYNDSNEINFPKAMTWYNGNFYFLDTWGASQQTYQNNQYLIQSIFGNSHRHGKDILGDYLIRYEPLVVDNSIVYALYISPYQNDEGIENRYLFEQNTFRHYRSFFLLQNGVFMIKNTDFISQATNYEFYEIADNQLFLRNIISLPYNSGFSGNCQEYLCFNRTLYRMSEDFEVEELFPLSHISYTGIDYLITKVDNTYEMRLRTNPFRIAKRIVIPDMLESQSASFINDDLLIHSNGAQKRLFSIYDHDNLYLLDTITSNSFSIFKNVFVNIDSNINQETLLQFYKVDYSGFTLLYEMTIASSLIHISFLENHNQLLIGTDLATSLYNIDFTTTSEVNQVTELHQNISVYPNPSSSENINFKLKNQQQAELRIYNIKGQLVKTMNIDTKHNDEIVSWNKKNEQNNAVSSGIYFYQLKSNNHTEKGKFLIIK